MSKRKILSLALTLCMVAILAVGGSLAYFMDSEMAVNTMTLGGVSIVQNEQQRNPETGALENFADNKPLLPMVDGRETGDAVVVDGFFNPKMENVVDKIVTVTNKGTTENDAAYVRTIFAFETTAEYEAGSSTNVLRDEWTIFDTYIGVLDNGIEGIGANDTHMIATINGKKYVIGYMVYDEVLDAGATTEPSLKQVFMAPTANNEIKTLFGDTYEILVLSQGVQAEGFEDAATALNTAFGEITAESCATWFTTTENKG